MSSSRPSRNFARVAVILPILVVGLAVAQAVWRNVQGQRWEFPLAAYDPRDFLRGKYLNVRFSFELNEEQCEGRGCCVCYEDAHFESDPPKLWARSCEEAKLQCAEWFEVYVLRAPYRYFIPEARSLEIEKAVIKAASEKRAKVEFVLDHKRRPQLTKITIDGEPIL